MGIEDFKTEPWVTAISAASGGVAGLRTRGRSGAPHFPQNASSSSACAPQRVQDRDCSISPPHVPPALNRLIGAGSARRHLPCRVSTGSEAR